MTSSSQRKPSQRGVLGWTVGLFSSVRFGIVLMVLLFIYCSIGSAGLMWPLGAAVMEPSNWYQLPVRQLAGLEMTEFEWFHWWPFDLLIALTCITMATVTIRRIPFKPVNYGVWMIHVGILTLAAGSFWYFNSKVEGDAPVVRRQVDVQLPGGERGSLVASPGAALELGEHRFQVIEIDPEWELLSGEDQGTRAFSVSILVEHDGQRFVRQLLAGYPQYTEDIIPGSGRAVKSIGRRLIDEELSLSLDHVAQDRFYVMSSRALYVREAGAREWVERRIDLGPPDVLDTARTIVAGIVPAATPPSDRLPRYSDAFPSYETIWLPPGVSGMEPRPLSIVLPSADGDPLAVDVTVDGYLRYAVIEERRRPGMGVLDPYVALTLESRDGRRESYQLAAFDPVAREAVNGELVFQWLEDEADRAEAAMIIEPRVRFAIPAEGIELEVPIRATTVTNPNLEFTPIEGTGYEFRFGQVYDDLQIRPGDDLSVAMVEIRNGDLAFQRFVCDDPSRNSDFAMDATPDTMHEQQSTLDPAIETRFIPGRAPAMVTILGGPDEVRLEALVNLRDREPVIYPLQPGSAVEISEGVTLGVEAFMARSEVDRRPIPVPSMQRDRDPRFMMSMIHVRLPEELGGGGTWLEFQDYAFRSENEVLRRYPHRPVTMTLADGRDIELLFSRRQHPLPAPVILEDFTLTRHVGGYTGTTASIRDWTSHVRFEEDGGWTDARLVSVNKPIEQDGFWFFQAQWDPPADTTGGSLRNGLTYTVLGVGNRNGVLVQLAGCCIAVIGMIYAFYVKPAIKRRRQQAVYAAVAEQRAEKPRESVAEPVAAGMETNQ